MNNQNTLIIDKSKFLKTSKKLHNLLNQLGLDIKLSQIQEIFSQSLGFRNLHHLQKAFTSLPFKEKENNLYTTTTCNIFSSLDFEQSIGIILLLMDNNGNDIWRGRAISFISTIFELLIYLQNNKEFIITTQIIKEYLELDTIIKTYKTRKDLPKKIKNYLKQYLFSLPTFQESAQKQNDLVYEQHDYLKMQFSTILNKLEKIENNNFIIADKSWFSIKTVEKIVGTRDYSEKGVSNTT
jgi:hypothetical protein